MGANLEEAVLVLNYWPLKKAWEGRQRLIEQNQQLDNAAKVGYDMESIAIDVKTNLQG